MNNKHVITAFAVVLLLYSSWRSWDYMVNNLSDIGQTTSWIIAFAFLFASEIGMILWLHYARPNSNTNIQETVSTLMIFVNFVGAMALNLADLVVHNKLYNVDMTIIDPVLFLTPWVLIAANVGGYIVYKMSDSEEQLQKAERQLEHEEIKFEIDARRQAIKELSKNRQSVAEKLAPHYVRNITDNVEGRTFKRFTRQANKIAKEELPTVEVEEAIAETSSNGRVKENGNPTKR